MRWCSANGRDAASTWRLAVLARRDRRACLALVSAEEWRLRLCLSDQIEDGQRQVLGAAARHASRRDVDEEMRVGEYAGVVELLLRARDTPPPAGGERVRIYPRRLLYDAKRVGNFVDIIIDVDGLPSFLVPSALVHLRLCRFLRLEVNLRHRHGRLKWSGIWHGRRAAVVLAAVVLDAGLCFLRTRLARWPPRLGRFLLGAAGDGFMKSQVSSPAMRAGSLHRRKVDAPPSRSQQQITHVFAQLFSLCSHG